MTPSEATSRIRAALLATLILGALGTFTELLLLEHYEDWWQWLPLVLLLLVAAAAAALWIRPARTSWRLFVATMWASVASGLIGQLLHYRGNSEFELEIFPNLSGLELFTEAMRGATPVLAPGTMTLLGLIGLVAAWGHSAARPPSSASRERTLTSS